MKKFFPWLLLLGCIFYLISGFKKPKSQSLFPINEFGQLPVLVGGRIKPFDTVARNSLMIIYGKQSLRTDKRSIPAIEWLIEVMMRPELANDRETFVIHHPDVLGMLGWTKTDKNQKKYFSYNQISSHLNAIEQQAKLAEAVEDPLRSLFQKEILKLYQRLELYHRLKNSLRVEGDINFSQEIELYEQSLDAGRIAILAEQSGKSFNQKDFDSIEQFANRYVIFSRIAYILPIPPIENQETTSWISIGQSLLQSLANKEINPIVEHYAAMVTAYRTSNPEEFSQHLSKIKASIDSRFTHDTSKARYEFRFNYFAPFYKSMTLYVLAFTLTCFAWLSLSQILNRSVFFILLLAFGVHTIGLISRMYLQGRPPVTNLYSSAIFVGWGAVFLGLILEKIYRDGVGSITSATLGFVTLLIAHHLSGDGDTMEMLRAVLDTNFWLATHVVVITLGYASTLLAGFLAMLYIFRGILTQSLNQERAQAITRMVYGIVCFATLFSFVGTILGGIWADQSWGRFWGWDPKENGALLIVIWNAIILHARWGGFIKQRGLMVMALFGNIVTSFSWFGVNMLGVGLHSYGFIDKAFFWLAAFMVSQVILMGIGILPLRYWRSFARNQIAPISP